MLKLKVIKDPKTFTTKNNETHTRYACAVAGQYVAVNTIHWEGYEDRLKLSEDKKQLTIEGKFTSKIEEFTNQDTGEVLTTKYVIPDVGL